MIDATFIISNRSALFEEAAAENITERDAHRRKLNSGLSCEDIQIPLALVKPSQYVFFDGHGFCCTARGHGKRTVSGRKSSAPTCP
jgi:hypothetical protein